jgi:hypothetical protein
MGFLDTRTLKIRTTVSKNWEQTAQKVLVKRSFLNIARWTSSVIFRMQQYPNWIVDFEIAEKTAMEYIIVFVCGEIDRRY